MANFQENRDGTWIDGVIPKEAKIKTYEKSTLFRMPDSGEYRGYIFYIPNKLVSEEEEDGGYAVGLPKSFEINLRCNGETKVLTADEFAAQFDDLTSLDWHKDTNRERPKTQKTVTDIKFPRSAVLEEREKSYKIDYPGEKGAVIFFGKSIVEIPVKGDVLTAHVPSDETTVYPKEGDRYPVKMAALKTMFDAELAKNDRSK